MSNRFLYFALYVAGAGFGLVKMMVVANELAPATFGAYSIAAVAAGLLGYLNSLGILDAFLVRLNTAHLDDAKRRIVRDSGMLFNVAVSIMSAAFATATYLIMYGAFGGHVLAAAIVTFLVAQNLFNVMMVELQATGRPRNYAALLTAKSLIPIIIVLIFEPGDSLIFFLALDSICLMLLCGFCLARTSIPKLSNFSGREVRSLMRQGLPFTGQNAVQNLSLNADKWAIGVDLGASQLGIYNLAAQLVVCGTAFASMIQVYFLPKVTGAAIEGVAPPVLMRRVLAVSVASFAASALLLTACAFLAIPLIKIFYPQYIDAISILPFTSVIGVMVACNQTDLYFRAQNMGRQYLVIQLITLVILVFTFGSLIIVGHIALWIYAAAFAFVRLMQLFMSYWTMYRDAFTVRRMDML